MKCNILFCTLCASILLAGCSSASLIQEEAPDQALEKVPVGNSLQVDNANDRFTLVDNNGTLAADGLYYVSWGIDASIPYENSDGDTVDLYDASLYLLLGEAKNPEKAQEHMDNWITAARSNYEILTEEEITCGGQSYTLITYNCTNEENPYDRGVSAFCTNGRSAVCAELTCQEQFTDDLKHMMADFLNGCTYTD